jgi:AraC-like DNA-binding protein
LDELDAVSEQSRSARFVAHEGTHPIAALHEAFCESATNFSGRSGDEDVHDASVDVRFAAGLEESATLGLRLRDRRARLHNDPMYSAARVAPPVSAVSALIMDERARDGAGVSIPRPEVRIVARFGPVARDGLDLHAMGVRQRAYRKVIRGGQRALVARLQLGTCQAVLGAPAGAIAERVVALDDLWGREATQRLREHLARARGNAEAAQVLECAIAERFALAGGPDARARLALEAAHQLSDTNVATVASSLGMSERKLRRVFHETFGLGPKAYAKLTRFHRALSAGRATSQPSWARIAAAAGYYDQAHLIAEFRAITGVTPRALLDELRSSPSLG